MRSSTHLNYRQETFAENVQRHLKKTGETKRQFAKRIDVPEVWLRRISTAGICWGNKRSQKNLEKLATAFGLKSPRELWRWTSPDSVDVDQVLGLLKHDYPRQWALLVAWQWSKGNGNGEELAERDLERAIPELPTKDANEIARRIAEYTDAQLEVVRRTEAGITVQRL